MYLYKVGYDTHEESAFREYKHEKCFTKEEFDKIVIDCIVEAIKGTSTNCSRDLVQKFMPDNEIFQYNMEKRGFQLPVYQQCFSVWGSVFDPEGWPGQEIEIANQVKKKLKIGP